MLIHVVKTKITRNLQKGQWDIKGKTSFLLPNKGNTQKKKKGNQERKRYGKESHFSSAASKTEAASQSA